VRQGARSPGVDAPQAEDQAVVDPPLGQPPGAADWFAVLQSGRAGRVRRGRRREQGTRFGRQRLGARLWARSPKGAPLAGPVPYPARAARSGATRPRRRRSRGAAARATAICSLTSRPPTRSATSTACGGSSAIDGSPSSACAPHPDRPDLRQRVPRPRARDGSRQHRRSGRLDGQDRRVLGQQPHRHRPRVRRVPGLVPARRAGRLSARRPRPPARRVSRLLRRLRRASLRARPPRPGQAHLPGGPNRIPSGASVSGRPSRPLEPPAQVRGTSRHAPSSAGGCSSSLKAGALPLRKGWRGHSNDPRSAEQPPSRRRVRWAAHVRCGRAAGERWPAIASGVSAPFVGGCRTNPRRARWIVSKGGLRNGHLLGHTRRVRRQVVAHGSPRVYFRERAAAFPRGLYATASWKSRTDAGHRAGCGGALWSRGRQYEPDQRAR
jgi:hypothetical protein